MKDLNRVEKRNVSLALNLFSHLTGAPMCNLRCMHKDEQSQKYMDQLVDRLDEIKDLVKEE